MDLLIFCGVILCVISFISSSLGFTFSFVEINSTTGEIVCLLPKCRRHEFTYRRGDEFTMYVKLDSNDSLSVTAEAEVTASGKKLQLLGFGGLLQQIKLFLDYDNISIDVVLSTVDGVFERMPVLVGKEATTPDALSLPWRTHATPSMSKCNNTDIICLNGHECMLHVDAVETCPSKQDNTYFILTAVAAAVIAVPMWLLLLKQIIQRCKKG